MKITSVRAAAIRDPSVFRDTSAAPRRWNEGTDSTNPLSRYREHMGEGARFANPWPDVVCVVTADDGSWGLGMSCYAGPVVSVINDCFAPMLLGEDPFATERMWNMMVRMSAARFGAAGLSSYAISAIDLALWDLKGKLCERPVYQLLGGPARESIHCYATGNDIDWYREVGFEAIKLCALHGSAQATSALDRNEAVVAAARDRVGPNFDLMMDFWPVHDAPFAVELASRLAGYDLRWVEDYLHPEDFVGYEHVRARLPAQTLAAGERWYTDRPFAMAARGRWLDIVQPDVQWVGGVTAVVKIAHIADAAGMEIALHLGCGDSYGQHLCLALPGNRWGEFLILTAPGEELTGGFRSTPGMALPVAGEVVPSDAPGFGIEMTLDMLEAAS